eukprot:COSAG02_NODE_4166_length_5680_cov_4.786418_2_plen_59_part_00
MAQNGAIPVPRGHRVISLGVNERVWAKAREFDKDWAEQTFGKGWGTAEVYEEISSEQR